MKNNELKKCRKQRISESWDCLDNTVHKVSKLAGREHPDITLCASGLVCFVQVIEFFQNVWYDKLSYLS